MVSDEVNLSSHLRCVYVVGALENYIVSYGVFWWLKTHSDHVEFVL